VAVPSRSCYVYLVGRRFVTILGASKIPAVFLLAVLSAGPALADGPPSGPSSGARSMLRDLRSAVDVEQHLLVSGSSRASSSRSATPRGPLRARASPAAWMCAARSSTRAPVIHDCMFCGCAPADLLVGTNTWICIACVRAVAEIVDSEVGDRVGSIWGINVTFGPSRRMTSATRSHNLADAPALIDLAEGYAAMGLVADALLEASLVILVKTNDQEILARAANILLGSLPLTGLHALKSRLRRPRRPRSLAVRVTWDHRERRGPPRGCPGRRSRPRGTRSASS